MIRNLAAHLTFQNKLIVVRQVVYFLMLDERASTYDYMWLALCDQWLAALGVDIAAIQSEERAA